MKGEEADHPQDELARLRQENARLRAMIDRLERGGGDEPASLAVDTQIIRSEAEPLPARTRRNSERPKKPRKRRKREQRSKPQHSIIWGCLLGLLVAVGISFAYIGLLLFSLAQVIHSKGFSLWAVLLILLISLLPLGGIYRTIEDIRRRRKRKRRISQTRSKSKAVQQGNSGGPRRRITRKLRAATTQKLDESDAG